MDSSSLTFLMHENVRKDAADRFDMHFWGYNAWHHYTISSEARRKFLRHDFSVCFKHIAQSCLYLSVNLYNLFHDFETMVLDFSSCT